ncbi:MAG: response regulator [Candidatus Poribacteria bacterium]|nr:response regulator [Candidatus Poribacteria bacterium]
MSKILIVEDEPDIVELLAYSLHRVGFETTTASNGEDALRHVNIQSPDLILLDLLLPRVDGLEVCRMLRACLKNIICRVQSSEWIAIAIENPLRTSL